MSRIRELAGDPAHTRSMTYTTYHAGEGHIVTECRLTDVRLRDYYKLTGDMVQSGTLHDLEVILLIRTPALVIEDIEVKMVTVPREDCLKVEQSLEPLRGLKVAKGFTAGVRNLCGGVKGCTHLVNLLTGAGSAIVQGYMAVSYQKQPDSRSDRAKKGRGMIEYLKNTCYAWREDGEAYRKLDALIRENESVDTDEVDHK